jgi:ABC-type histidine transport system ATPase subunit
VTTNELLLEVSDIHVAYGQVEAVRGVSICGAQGKNCNRDRT